MKLRRFSSPNYPWRLALAVMLANLAAFAILAAGARMHRVLADRPRPDASLASRVTVIRTPNGGIQPQLAVDRRGVVHLLYFTGDPAAGDLDYVQWDAARSPSRAVWSARRRVNSVRGSAMAIGSVRGGQIALGERGRVHVAWLGSAKATPRGPKNATPMIYTRLDDAGTAFEPERNVMQFATGLDGGGSVAADGAGNVYVVWHANPAANGERHREVWMARSHDGGRTFARETVADGPGAEHTGACGCCGMRAFADRTGALYILYRAATDDVHRDMVLLRSEDDGRNFTGDRVARWTLNACPMSTDAIASGPTGVLGAWETAGQVYYSRVEPLDPVARRSSLPQVSTPISPPGGITVDPSGEITGPTGDRKHPAIATNAQGETILAWTEGTAWAKGGSVAWQVFDASGHPMGPEGHSGGLPVWGLVAVFANPRGGFTVIY